MKKKEELAEEKAGLSRRDFLKDVGGGAIGTVMISTGLLSGSSLEAAQKGKKKIPEALTQADFKAIRQFLESVLKELTGGKTDAMIVNMRLNKTGTEKPAPVFVGWVEDATLKKLRAQRKEKDPGSFRLKDTVPAKEYDETLNAKGVIRERDWCALNKDGRATLAEKSPQQKALVPRAGLMYQRLIGIVVQDGNVSRCVGTLNLAFPKKPADQMIQSGDTIIKTWATGQESKLVQFLRDNFELGGPAI